MFHKNRRVLTLALGSLAMLAVTLAIPANANADAIPIHRDYDSDTNTSIETWLIGDGFNWKILHILHDKNNNTFHWLGDGNPSHDGQPTGLAPDKEAILALLEKLGGSMTYEEDPWRHLFNHSNASHDLGPTVIDPAPFGGVAQEDGSQGGGANGGFDPNVPFGDQVPNQRGSEDDDEGNDNNDNDLEFWQVDPELIDPSPEPVDLEYFLSLVYGEPTE